VIQLRLDPERAVAQLSAATGERLTVERPCPGGQLGAAYVRWPDGRRSVLKRIPHCTVATLRRGPLAVAEALRAQGYPAPAVQLAAQVGGAVLLVQDLLPGQPAETVDPPFLQQALALNRRQRGSLQGRPDIPSYELHLRHDGPGICLHEPLRRFSPRSRALERRIAALGAQLPDRLAGDDAVHGDFHARNLLVQRGRVAGVIDWDRAARGDCRFDLAVLRFLLRPGQSAPGVSDRLDRLLDAAPEELARGAWAHISLRMVDWAIRHFAPPRVEAWLDVTDQRVI
jgi:Phosphotransferase enzyme family